MEHHIIFTKVHNMWGFLEDSLGCTWWNQCNISSLAQSVKYDVMNTTDTTTMVYYVINFVSEFYTLQEDTTCDGQISKFSEMVVKAQYLICVK